MQLFSKAACSNSGEAVSSRVPVVARPGAPQRRRKIWIAAACVCAAALLGWGLVLWLGAAGTPQVRASIAVLGFNDLSNGADSDSAKALSAGIAAELGIGRDLRVASAERVARLKLQLNPQPPGSYGKKTLALIRQNTGADFAVWGQFANGNGVVRLNIVVAQTKLGTVAASIQQSGRSNDLQAMSIAVAAAVRAKLGMPRLPREEQSFARAVLPSNSDALRLYAAALDDLYLWKYQAASALFAQSIASDPAYSLAYAGLARSLFERGDTEQAISRIRQALRLSQPLPQRQRLAVEAEYYKIESEWSKALDVYRRLFQLYPDSLDYGLAAAGLETGAQALDTLAALGRMPEPMRSDPRIDILKASVELGLRKYPDARLAAETAAIKARQRSARDVLATAVVLQAQAERTVGQMKRAEALYAQAERIAAALGDRVTETEALGGRAAISVDAGALKEAASLYAEALEIGRAAQSPRISAAASAGLGRVRLEQGDLAQASQLLVQSLALMYRQQSYAAIPPEKTDLAELYLRQGQLQKSSQYIGDALKALANTRGRPEVEALSVLARLRVEQGQITAASQAVSQALQIASELSDKYSPARVLLTAGYLAREQGALAAARKQYTQALHSFSKLHLSAGAAEARLGLARVALDEGNGSSAASLAREAHAELANEGRVDRAAAARAIEASADLLRNRISAAQKALQPALRRNIQDRLAKDLVEIAAARLQARRGNRRGAVAKLRTVAARAAKDGLVRDRLEAELALAQIDPNFDAQQLASEAARLGFQGIANRAGGNRGKDAPGDSDKSQTQQ